MFLNVVVAIASFCNTYCSVFSCSNLAGLYFYSFLMLPHKKRMMVCYIIVCEKTENIQFIVRRIDISFASFMISNIISGGPNNFCLGITFPKAAKVKFRKSIFVQLRVPGKGVICVFLFTLSFLQRFLLRLQCVSYFFH